MRNIDRRHKIIITTVLMAALSLSLVSCSFASFDVDSGENLLFGQGGNESHGSVQVYNGDGEEITIGKAESITSNGEKITSAGQAYNSVSEVYVAVADSVVEITTETVQTSGWMGQYISKGAGSGVIVDGSGFIVTNNHVIEGANNIIVRLTDGSEYQAMLVGADKSADLAVLKINPDPETTLTVAELGCSADLVVGEDVIALGNPLGSLGGTLTTGIISATERNMTVNGEEMVLLQTNAAINPGNSGGGLFNMAGQLIGVVNAKASGEDVEGLGFAIPVDFAHKVIEDLINYGYVRGVADHGLIVLDVTAQNLPAAYRKYGVTTVGVIILESKYSSELVFGDKIVSLNGYDIESSADIERIVKSCSIGDSVKIGIVRDGSPLEIILTLHESVPEIVNFD